jgi:hypothetical protein
MSPRKIVSHCPGLITLWILCWLEPNGSPLWIWKAVIGTWICIQMIKTAFSMHHALWQFTLMPFGLWNTPVMSEQLMETIWKYLTYKSCLVYLDDGFVIGCTFQRHLLNLQKVFHQFREASQSSITKVSTFSEGSMVPRAYCVPWEDNWLRETLCGTISSPAQ